MGDELGLSAGATSVPLWSFLDSRLMKEGRMPLPPGVDSGTGSRCISVCDRSSCLKLFLNSSGLGKKFPNLRFSTPDVVLKCFAVVAWTSDCYTRSQQRKGKRS